MNNNSNSTTSQDRITQETNLSKAKRSCKHCCGTGISGKMYFTGKSIVCICVIKAVQEEADFLKNSEEKQQ